MSDIYVARQPIFNNRMKLFGYELLYRRGAKNEFDGASDDQATASIITDSFFMGFDELIDGTRGFINFSQNLLLSGAALLLPSEKLVIEIVERTEITPLFVAACRRLKQLGYKLALDNFIDDEAYRPLVELADIIKVDYHRTPAAVQALLIKKYSGAAFVAMKIETADEFQHANSLGYSLFQGYFFDRPTMIGAREIGTLHSSMVQMVQKLSLPDPDLKTIAAIVERDVELSYKLLRIANSAYYRTAVMPVNSIRQALAQLGVIELRRWSHLLLVKGLMSPDNAELVKSSLIRARMLALYAAGEPDCGIDEQEAFLAGLFSAIDRLLGEPMPRVLSRLPLTVPVKAALLGESGPLRDALDAVLAFERADWESADSFLNLAGMPRGALTPIYLEAVKWQQTLSV
jgi:EAL and modified HD-GYP domain-containing signal transduction protein